MPSAQARDPKAIWAPDEIPADAADDEAELEEEAAELEVRARAPTSAHADARAH